MQCSPDAARVAALFPSTSPVVLRRDLPRIGVAHGRNDPFDLVKGDVGPIAATLLLGEKMPLATKDPDPTLEGYHANAEHAGNGGIRPNTGLVRLDSSLSKFD